MTTFELTRQEFYDQLACTDAPTRRCSLLLFILLLKATQPICTEDMLCSQFEPGLYACATVTAALCTPDQQNRLLQLLPLSATMDEQGPTERTLNTRLSRMDDEKARQILRLLPPAYAKSMTIRPGPQVTKGKKTLHLNKALLAPIQLEP